MGSKYLSALSKDDYTKLTKKLWNIQNHRCFICEEEINIELNSTNIDHIKPLANKGKDSEDNFAVTHESCNKSKQDANLRISRILAKLKKIQNNVHSQKNKSASLKDVLKYYGGSKYDFKYTIKNNTLSCSFSDNGDNSIYKTLIFKDNLSDEKSCFIEIPIEYLFHDEIINPRGINNSIGKLVKEFDKGIIDKKDNDITDEHLIAFRMSKEEILHNWIQYLKMVIKAYFVNMGNIVSDDKLFQHKFDGQLWQNIENFIKNLSELPLWKDRSMASTIFAGKNNYDYWKTIFGISKSPNSAIVLAKSLNFMEMIQYNIMKKTNLCQQY